MKERERERKREREGGGRQTDRQGAFYSLPVVTSHR